MFKTYRVLHAAPSRCRGIPSVPDDSVAQNPRVLRLKTGAPQQTVQNSKFNGSRLATRLHLTILAALLLAGCGGAGADSPEAVCQQIKQSIEKKDIGGFYDCLTAESQDVVAGSMVLFKMASAMAAAMGGPEAAQEFAEVDAVLEKHGVTDEALKSKSPDMSAMNDPNSVKELASVVKDKRAFVADMFAVMEKLGQGGPDLSKKLTGELKDVKIEGDKATAKLVTVDGEEELDFRKTAAGWKLHIDMEKMNAAEEAELAPVSP